MERENGKAQGMGIPIDDRTGAHYNLKWADKVSSLQGGTPASRENVCRVLQQQ